VPIPAEILSIIKASVLTLLMLLFIYNRYYYVFLENNYTGKSMH